MIIEYYPEHDLTLLVGPLEKQVKFLVLKQDLCDRSRYFCAMFNPKYSFRESSATELFYPDDDPAAFKYAMDMVHSVGGVGP